MTDVTLDEMGPIDYVVVEFPGNKMTGEGLPILVDLVDRGIIRLIDLVFFTKADDGSVAMVEIADFDGDGELDLAIFEGASSGILGEDDINEAAAAVEGGSSAALLVYENRWAAPFAAAVRRGGGQLVAFGRIPIQALARRARRRRLNPTHRGGHPMPGLIRGVARTAVVAGTATHVSNNVSGARPTSGLSRTSPTRGAAGRGRRQRPHLTPSPSSRSSASCTHRASSPTRSSQHRKPSCSPELVTGVPVGAGGVIGRRTVGISGALIGARSSSTVPKRPSGCFPVSPGLLDVVMGAPDEVPPHEQFFVEGVATDQQTRWRPTPFRARVRRRQGAGSAGNRARLAHVATLIRSESVSMPCSNRWLDRQRWRPADR